MIERATELAAVSLDDAHRDELTGIGNRRFFERRLAEGVGAGEGGEGTTVVLLLDLDRFKSVNDTLGHAVGDMLLRRVVERVGSQLRGRDSFARLGGDEFGVVPEGCDVEDLAARIVDLVQRTYLIDGSPVNIGVSIGIARYPQDARDARHLMRCADLALYQAKSAGRNCFVLFEPAMEVKAREKRAMEMDLRKAVALRQMEVHYRSQVDVQSLRLVGLEAVLQWRHPTRGVLPAEEFLPLAEETGVVVSIGEWALKAVCREAARWPTDVVIALRLSPLQFESSRFLEVLTRALKVHELEGSRLELEVTEAILLRDGKAVMSMLERLRALGVRVAVDSFGAGVASLSQMAHFPMDKIKIARSLVAEQGTGIRERAIVRAIAALGASLGVSTVVEGVSTPEHLSRIQRDGCASLQGCLISDAVPASSLRGVVDQLLTFTSDFQPPEVCL